MSSGQGSSRQGSAISYIDVDSEFCPEYFSVCLKKLIDDTILEIVAELNNLKPPQNAQKANDIINQIFNNFNDSNNEVLKYFADVYYYNYPPPPSPLLPPPSPLLLPPPSPLLPPPPPSLPTPPSLFAKIAIAITNDRRHDLNGGDRCEEGLPPETVENLIKRFELNLPNDKLENIGYYARDTTNDNINEKKKDMKPLNYIAQIADTANHTHYDFENKDHYIIGQKNPSSNSIVELFVFNLGYIFYSSFQKSLRNIINNILPQSQGSKKYLFFRYKFNPYVLEKKKFMYSENNNIFITTTLITIGGSVSNSDYFDLELTSNLFEVPAICKFLKNNSLTNDFKDDFIAGLVKIFDSNNPHLFSIIFLLFIILNKDSSS